MAVITIKIQNKDGMTLSVARGEDEAALVYTKEYEEGDEIIFEISPKNAFYELMADDALGAATVYVTGDVHYRIPFGERKISYSPKTFSGNRHLITAKLADMTYFGSCRILQKCDGPAWGDQLLSACVGECGDARGGGVRRQKRDRRRHGE